MNLPGKREEVQQKIAFRPYRTESLDKFLAVTCFLIAFKNVHMREMTVNDKTAADYSDWLVTNTLLPFGGSIENKLAVASQRLLSSKPCIIDSAGNPRSRRENVQLGYTCDRTRSQ